MENYVNRFYAEYKLIRTMKTVYYSFVRLIFEYRIHTQLVIVIDYSEYSESFQHLPRSNLLLFPRLFIYTSTTSFGLTEDKWPIIHFLKKY